ncbi:NADH-quinone oxidoreductase subunit N [Alteribacter natronophilus]|uniref:NADH-quinone oxidoreductase subunit N n=1 Tax=Alteribacter natronophilus TaxID=2583810 RepID=UPI00110E5482|nr:NADH-quinone oxidoreductase subunit N [Alteribacter natronophilus]TMW72182.1 NADH-quinone oxidoreductase subunit N [Alteribacter natronophilus]
MISYTADWSLLTPEIVLAAFALLIFTIDFMTGVKGHKPFAGRLSIVALVTAAVLMITVNGTQSAGIGDTFLVDPFSTVVKVMILLGAALVVMITMYYVERHEDVYQGELYSLILFAVIGALIMVSSADLITLFIGLELLSISAYCMVGFKRYRKQSAEAAVKYIVLGGTASAFILYGMSFLYGLTGSTSLTVIGGQIGELFQAYPFLIMMSLLFILGGFAFKMSVVPFHMWAPDVYEGAPVPVTAFLSAISKIAAFAVVLRLFFTGFGGIYEEWAFLIAVIAALTMIAGSLIALPQRNVKRLMAYSGIAQAGFLLVPLAAVSTVDLTISVFMFYAVAYMLMTIGAFAVITAVTETAGSEDVSAFSGLYYRSPFLALGMSAFLVSLAGLPVSAGIIGKAWIFIHAVSAGYLWLAAVMVAATVISFFYYFRIIHRMFTQPGEAEAARTEVAAALEPGSLPAASPGIITVVAFSLTGTIGLGLVPFILTNWFTGLTWF